MFDLTSTKLLILAVVALVVVGPKDFPILLRTIGKYMGVLKRHAEEFRGQFDQAMREAELSEMRAEVERMSREIEQSVREADKAIASSASEAGHTMQASLEGTNAPPAPEPAELRAAIEPTAVPASAAEPVPASQPAHVSPTAGQTPQETSR